MHLKILGHSPRRPRARLALGDRRFLASTQQRCVGGNELRSSVDIAAQNHAYRATLVACTTGETQRLRLANQSLLTPGCYPSYKRAKVVASTWRNSSLAAHD